MLKACIESVESQSCKDFQHILIREDQGAKGYGILAAEAALKKPWPIQARYVMVLDDDNMLVDMDFVRIFKALVDKDNPDIVFFRSFIKSLGIMPSLDRWRKPPECGFIDYFCYALRTEFRDKYINDVPVAQNQDFLLIEKCYQNTTAVLWLDRFVARTQDLPARTRPQEDLP
jgi:hypothetical protein